MTGLISSEWLRLRSRRLVRILTVLFFAIWTAVLVGNFLSHHKTDPPGKLMNTATILPEAAQLVGGAALAVMAFIVGAAYAGADWQAGTIQALLFWEPRRARVMLAKVATLVMFVVLLGVVVLLYFLPGLYLVGSARGSTVGVNGDVWRDTVSSGGRGLAIAVFAGLLGFAVAHLTRNTGGALGAGFVWFAILESIVAGLRPQLTHLMIVPNIAAWISGQFDYSVKGVQHVIGRGQGGLYLLVVTTLAIGIATALFARRDVT